MVRIILPPTPASGPYPRRQRTQPDLLDDTAATDAAALLLLFRRHHVRANTPPRTTPREFLDAVNRHLLARGVNILTSDFEGLPPLSAIQRGVARHILHAVHDAWAAADPTPGRCRKCGCVAKMLAGGGSAQAVLREKLGDVVAWIVWEPEPIPQPQSQPEPENEDAEYGTEEKTETYSEDETIGEDGD